MTIITTTSITIATISIITVAGICPTDLNGMEVAFYVPNAQVSARCHRQRTAPEAAISHGEDGLARAPRPRARGGVQPDAERLLVLPLPLRRLSQSLGGMHQGPRGVQDDTSMA